QNFLPLRVHLDSELDILAFDRAFERRFGKPPFVCAGQFLALLLQNERGIGWAILRFKSQFPIAGDVRGLRADWRRGGEQESGDSNRYSGDDVFTQSFHSSP